MTSPLSDLSHPALLELATQAARRQGILADAAATAALAEIQRRQAKRNAALLYWVAYLEARRN